jgi:hypothetical protein
VKARRGRERLRQRRDGMEAAEPAVRRQLVGGGAPSCRARRRCGRPELLHNRRSVAISA